jgi:hypothetical protein
MCRIWGIGFRVLGFGFRVEGSECRWYWVRSFHVFPNSGFEVEGLRF